MIAAAAKANSAVMIPIRSVPPASVAYGVAERRLKSTTPQYHDAA
jgi:hypothetical protein